MSEPLPRTASPVRIGGLAALVLGLLPSVALAADGNVLYSNGTTTPRYRTYSATSNTFGAETATVAGAAQTWFVNRAAPTRNEHIAGYVTTGGVLYVLRWNGSTATWTNEWNVTVGGNGVNGRRFDIAYEQSSGRCVVVYSGDTAGTIAYRIWDGSSWAASTTKRTVWLSGVPNDIRLAARTTPGSNELAAAIADANSPAALTALVWDGTAWGNEPSAGALSTAVYRSAATGDTPAFDAAYESNSGHLVVVNSINGANGVAYHQYVAPTWTSNTLTSTQGHGAVSLTANPDTASNQILLVASRRTGNANIYQGIWNGSAWSAWTQSVALSATYAVNRLPFAGAWLRSGATTAAVVFYDGNTSNQLNYIYSTNSGTSWSAAAQGTVTLPAIGRWWWDAAIDPASPGTALVTLSDNSSDLWAKRVVLSAGPTFTFSNADGGTAESTTLASVTSQNFQFAYDRAYPDLSLTMTGSWGNVCQGSSVTYAINVTNSGSVPATTVTVTDTLPAGLTFVSATPSQGGPCTISAGTVSCPLGTLAAGGTATVTLVATGTTPGAKSNTANVAAAERETVTTNNDATVSTTVTASCIDVSLTKAFPAGSVRPGQNATFTLTVKNNSATTNATGVTITDPLPAELTYVSATPSQGGPCTAGPPASCPIGTLAPGASATVSLVASANSVGGPVNTATATMNEGDSNPANNTGWTWVGIQPFVADLRIVKTANTGSVAIGGSVTYTLTVTNLGPAAASAVTVTDPIPPGMSLVSASPSQGSCSGNPLVACTLGSIAFPGSATVTIVATNTSAGTKSNTATVLDSAAGDFDPDMTNNNSTVTTVVTGAAAPLCATPGQQGAGGTLSGIVNTYWPGTASVSAGVANTCIPVGAARGAGTTIAADNLLLVIQMQDADIDSSNTAFYGDGTGIGAGATGVGAGRYEFVTARGPIGSGGCAANQIPVSGTGSNNGLQNSYSNAAATGTKGQMRYQVVFVPQYTTATLAGVTAAPWTTASTGSADCTPTDTLGCGTGGILAMDVQGTLTLASGVAATVDGLGFRGGAGRQLTGDTGTAPVAPVTPLDAWTNVWTAAPGNNSGTVTTLPFTVSPGSQRLLLVAVALELTTARQLTPLGATYGGVTMTSLVTTGGANRLQHAALFYLTESQIPAGSNTVVVNYTLSGNGSVRGIHVKAASYQGVYQANPINDSAANYAAAANVTFGSAVAYAASGLTVYVATNGGTPATLSAPPADFVAVAGATTTSNNLSSFIGESPAEAAANSYGAGTTITFGGTTANSSAVAVASLAPARLAATDWRTPSTRTTNGSKGEGIAGTPEYVQTATGPSQTNQPNDGYPGGSYARGAPANAGGGSTDDNPAGNPGNDRNSGGGGGSNGGAGGTGGHSWSTCLDRGGRGAAVTPAITKLVLGGGGGAGTRNNSDGDVQAAGGAAGGGLMVLRAAQIVASSGAILSANGADAYDGTANDGSGGGGAGGSVILTVTSGTLGGLTIQAHGGKGGSNWLTAGNGGAGCDNVNANHHGPGGGGGGGVIVYTNTATPPTLDVSGGQPGVTTADENTFAAQPGGVGQLLYPGPGSIPGYGSGSECTSDPAVALTHSGTTVAPGGTATVTATVRNAAPYKATSGRITVVINLGSGPPALTATAVTATGWTCSGVPGAVVTCYRDDSLAAQLSYPAIVITTSVGSADQPGTITNTATLTNGADVNLSNNLATDPIGVSAPTLARIRSFRATRSGRGVELTWRSGFEADNLGFVVYRESGGVRREVTPSVVAGSALMVGPKRPLPSGRSYAWVDSDGAAQGDVRYWLEDVDLDGTRRFTGPAIPEISTKPRFARLDEEDSPTLGELARSVAEAGRGAVKAGHGTVRAVEPPASVQALGAGTYSASRPAAKILVKEEGWYRVTKGELLAAGFDPGTDPAALQLFAERTEQAMVVRDGGDGRFDASDSIEFYGLGLDSPWTSARVYWLIAGAYPGQRVSVAPAGSQLPAGPASVPFTVERRDHVVYFAALTADGDVDNFFGPPVTTTALDQTLEVAHLDAAAGGSVPLTVALQGVTNEPHAVDVGLNGHDAGTLAFQGQAVGTATFTVPLSWVAEGTNTVTLTARASATDTSVVESVRLVYPHLFRLDGGALRITVPGGTRVTFEGLTDQTLRIVDATKPSAVRELPVTFRAASGGFAGEVQVADGEATLYAFTPDRIAAPSGLVPNVPSDLSNKKTKADFVIVSHPSLLASVEPLRALREAQGLATVVADVTDVYDEFGYGEKSPDAIREFLKVAREKWSRAPRFVLLVGDASFDPKDYLGFGDFDLVPTRMVKTAFMLTDSDDALADFDGDGLPEMAVGRLPVRTPAEAATVISKIVTHDTPGAAGAWSSKVLLVSDAQGEFDFSAASAELVPLVPAGLSAQPVAVDTLGSSGARTAVLDAVNAGQLLVNYMGHGSVDVWGQSAFFDGNDAGALTNGAKLPTFVLMTCLNGLFDDLFVESLAERLVKAPAGGAVAVWASSTLTAPEPQAAMNKAFFQALQGSTTRLGDAVRAAKASVSDPDVRRSWILFGDPTMRVRPAP